MNKQKRISTLQGSIILLIGCGVASYFIINYGKTYEPPVTESPSVSDQGGKEEAPTIDDYPKIKAALEVENKKIAEVYAMYEHVPYKNFTHTYLISKQDGHIYLDDNFPEDGFLLLEGADSETFEVVGVACSVEKSLSYLSKDDNQVFVGSKEISKDPDNFAIIDSLFNADGMPTSAMLAIDSVNLYYGCGEKLEGFDIKNFRYLGDGRFTDGENTYQAQTYLNSKPIMMD